MVNIKLTIAYDGSQFNGFQKQPKQLKARTVQEELEAVLSKVLKEQINLFGAGRTDAGVHAKNQVVNFFTTNSIPVDKIPLALNQQLPQDISVSKAEIVKDDFHARYNAKGKIYNYTILNSQLRDPFLRLTAWHIPMELDFNRIQEATNYFVGTHNFKAFCATRSGKKDYVRTIDWLDVEKKDNIITFRIKGKGFLYNMVRIIVGTLVEVGRGRYSPEKIKYIIESQDRKKSGRTAPPHGLCLEEIIY